MTRNDPNRGNYPSKCLVLDLNPWKAFWAILVPFKCPRLSSWVTSGTTEKQGNVTISQRTALGWEDTFNNNWCNFFVPKNWGGLGLTLRCLIVTARLLLGPCWTYPPWWPIWTVFLQECPSWLLIGSRFYSSHRENRVFTAAIDRTVFLH